MTDVTNPLLDRGPADFDNRHRVAISGIWDIPFAKNTHGWVKQVLDGWSLAPVFTARTGFGFTVYDCSNTQFQQCPRLQVDGKILRQANGHLVIDQLIGNVPNSFGILRLDSMTLPGSFTSPITGNSDFGPYPKDMTGRGIFQSPGYKGFDLGVHKWFFLTERFKLEMRVDLFNAFNHPNLFLAPGTAEFSSLPGSSDGHTYLLGCKGGCTGSALNGQQQHRNIQLGARLTF